MALRINCFILTNCLLSALTALSCAAFAQENEDDPLAAIITPNIFAYHLTERLFFEASGGVSEAGETSFELLSGSTAILTEDQREYLYYDLSIGLNIFNGQIYLGKENALNADFYITAGVGNTFFANDTFFTSSLGAGSRFYITDWLAAHADIDIRSFEHELLGEEKVIYNIEPTVGLTFFF